MLFHEPRRGKRIQMDNGMRVLQTPRQQRNKVSVTKLFHFELADCVHRLRDAFRKVAWMPNQSQEQS